MASYNTSSLIPTVPTLQPHPSSIFQNTNTTYQNSNATQPNANQSSCIQFGIGESGTAPCGITSVGVRIACSQGGTAIYFSGEVVGGSKVAASDLEAFRQALQEKVNASIVLVNSAIQASATLVPKHGMPNQNGKVTRESAAKVAAALGADHRRAAGGSPRLHRMAES
jgi:hypothetical protein